MRPRWADIGLGDRTVHVVPINDMKRHRESGVVCWCQPTVRRYANGHALVVHNSMDGRELIEEHGVQ